MDRRLSRGDKLSFRNDGILAEVQSLQPSGQAGMREDHYDILLNGVGFKLPSSVLKAIFKLVEVDPDSADSKKAEIESILEENSEVDGSKKKKTAKSKQKGGAK